MPGKSDKFLFFWLKKTFSYKDVAIKYLRSAYKNTSNGLISDRVDLSLFTSS